MAEIEPFFQSKDSYHFVPKWELVCNVKTNIWGFRYYLLSESVKARNSLIRGFWLEVYPSSTINLFQAAVFVAELVNPEDNLCEFLLEEEQLFSNLGDAKSWCESKILEILNEKTNEA
jgi:uncharacterized membrane protein YpjA